MVPFRRALPVLVLGCGLMTGCASIVNHGSRTVTIGSSPSGVPFVVKNKSGVEVASGATPWTQVLTPSAGFFQGEHYSVIYKPQWAPEQIQPLDSSLSGWYFGNIIFGGFIGLLIIDPATGAMWNLPSAVMANLPPTPTPTPTVVAPVDATASPAAL